MSGSPYMRLASQSDVPELREMLINDDRDDYIPDVIEEWIGEKGTYVATDGREILGMAHKEKAPDGSLWLNGLRVRGSARRKGVGRIISDFMVNLPDANIYRLVINEVNEASIGLTLKVGYTERFRASLWVSKTGADEPEWNEVDYEDIGTESFNYFGKSGGLIPTSWYAFELNERAKRVLSDFGLKFVSDRGMNIFLHNREHKVITPLVLRKKELLTELPEGYVLFGNISDDFSPLGFDQSLWAERLIFFEYARTRVFH